MGYICSYQFTNMKRSLLIFLVLLIATTAFGQQQSVLWEISGNGLNKKSYLFGSVHISSVKILNTFPKLKTILTGAELGLFELNGRPIGQNSTIPVDVKEVPQPPLDSIFTKEEYELVDKFFASTPVGSMRPHNNDASLGGMLQLALTYKNTKGAQYITLDDYLAKVMDSLAKPTFALDDLSDPSKMAFESRYRMIAEAVIDVIKMGDQVNMMSEYGFADFEQTLMADLWLTRSPDHEMAKVTVERNKVWFPKILKMVHSQSCFIAVGLGHLRFNSGLIMLLRDKGYTVKPVMLSN